MLGKTTQTWGKWCTLPTGVMESPSLQYSRLGHPSLWEWLRSKAINPAGMQGNGLHDLPAVSSRLNEPIIHRANKKTKGKTSGGKKQTTKQLLKCFSFSFLFSKLTLNIRLKKKVKSIASNLICLKLFLKQQIWERA